MKQFLSLASTLILLLGLCACAQKPLTWQEQYDLGVRYLEEGNYEEAIIAFTAAIEIDPKQAPAYVGRGDAYTAQGNKAEDTAAAYELYQKAIADYEQAVALGSDEAQSKLDSLQAEIQRIQVSLEAEPRLKELYACLISDDIEGAKSLMRQQEYRELSAAAEGSCFTYSESEDVCLAVYGDDYYYFGQWESGQRNGQGLWIKAAFDDESTWESRQYNGAWADDLPNGDGEIVSVKNLNRIHVEEGHTTSIRTEIAGTFKDGLYSGTIYETWHMNDGSVHVWTPINAIDGIYQPMPNVPEDLKDRHYYQDHVASGKYIVAVDQQNNLTDLWDDGSPRSVFGLGEG